jgi:phenylalanyl-tRNA synthetase beta chain
MSHGMMASPKELALGDSHEGILEIDTEVAPGTRFADAFNLVDDRILDIENKMFTHRPDCFGFLGVAREIAGIQHTPYKSPEWYQQHPVFPAIESEELPLVVRNSMPNEVPRFTAIVLRDVKVGPSPVWLQVELSKVGLRSINNIVDYTNFFMLETGQPLHAYDYDKVRALDSDSDTATLVVRKPKQGEKILLLNGKEVEPRSEAILIATRERAIGIGGVMGGGETEVDEHTKNIIIECATFDMYSIRRTSMAHGLFTDAVTRFNKGQSPLQNLAVLAKIVDEIREHAGGKVASRVIDDNHVAQAAMERGSLHAPVTASAAFVNERLGIRLAAEEMATLLRNVEFTVEVQGETLTVTAPFWRTDIELPEDIVEEVGRLYGFDRLPLELPLRSVQPSRKNSMLEVKARIRQILVSAGANEVLTYSFVHGNLLEKAGQDKAQAFRLANALSPDLQYYRLSVVPSLLERIHPNIKAGYDEFALFEMGKVHDKSALEDDGLPKESERLAFVYAAKAVTQQGAPFYEARRYLEHLAGVLGVQLAYTQLSAHETAMDGPFELGRSAIVRISGENAVLGIVGEVRSETLARLKLPDNTAAFEIDTMTMSKHIQSRAGYRPLPKFPKVAQDICLKVAAGIPYGEVLAHVETVLSKVAPGQTITDVFPIDIYQRSEDTAHKQITLRISVTSYERTLTDAEVAGMLDSIASSAKDALQADRV